jgi:threonine dehydratase
MVTPQEQFPALAKAIGLTDLYLKREDLHPYGSHKGRSIPFMIDHYFEQGLRNFAISSSGNAALAAALYVKELNSNSAKNGNQSLIHLDIFVGIHLAPNKLAKLKKLEGDHIRVLTKERPLQSLMQASEEGARSLRQSTDDLALIGYKSLAEELAKIPNLAAIFIGTSSGTTAQALAQYFMDLKTSIQIHIVQTSSCHPLSDAFETFDGEDEQSIANAIVDKTARRKDALIPLIKKTGGYGWFATNDEIRAAQELVKKHAGFEISANSALSIVGAMEAAYRSWPVNGAVVCMICGD